MKIMPREAGRPSQHLWVMHVIIDGRVVEKRIYHTENSLMAGIEQQADKFGDATFRVHKYVLNKEVPLSQLTDRFDNERTIF